MEGVEAHKMFAATSGKFYHLFSFQGKIYSVILRPIFPHECIERDYYQENDKPGLQEGFTYQDM
jgi:hypothetical protein